MKKIRHLFAGLAGSVLLLLGFWTFRNFDTLLFHRITETFFVNSLENDALNLHFTLAYPEKSGITLKSASLPAYSDRSARQSAKAAQDLLKELSRIDPVKLKEEDRYTYDLLFSYLELDAEGQKFSYYEEPLSPSLGMQSELPLLMAEYTLRNKEDVEIYLSLLDSVDDYFQGLADYETAKSQAGLFMPVEDAQSVIAQCDQMMNAASLSEGSHFLQITFDSRLEKLCRDNLLTAQEKNFYRAENNRILSTVVLPAYQQLADDLTLLSGTGLYHGGLYEKPDGRDYYAWLVKRTTGSALDIDSIYILLQKTFQKKFDEMKSMALKYRELTGNSPDPAMLSEDFPLSDPTGILTDLQARMREDFPPLTALSTEKIDCTIKTVDSALEAYTSPAFYMTPPVDDLTHNTICINRASTSDGIELYTTLAHEGYPGHLYQTVYSSLYASAQQKLPIRKLLFYGGYVEGWAYYTEQLSYDYAASLLSETDSHSQSALLCRLLSTQRDLQINLFSILDMALHYYGASKEDILHSLTSFGLPAETAERVYRYLRTAPAVYLKYYVGYLEMTALQARARAQWGSDFSLLEFHRFVLKAGPSDFLNLTKRLKNTNPGL